MVMAIGISALIGGALGLRWNVFILIPTIILAALSMLSLRRRADIKRCSWH